MNSIYKKKKTSSSASQLATCSLVCGAVGLFFSFFYLPVSLMNASIYPRGAIYGLNGIVLAISLQDYSAAPEGSFWPSCPAALLTDREKA